MFTKTEILKLAFCLNGAMTFDQNVFEDMRRIYDNIVTILKVKVP